MTSIEIVRAAEARVPGLRFERDGDRARIGGVYPWQGWGLLGNRYAYFRLRSNSASLRVHTGLDDESPIWKSSSIYPVYGDAADDASMEEHGYDSHVDDDFFVELVTRLVDGLRPPSWTNPTYAMQMDRTMLGMDATTLATPHLKALAATGYGTEQIFHIAYTACQRSVVEAFARRAGAMFYDRAATWVQTHQAPQSDQGPQGPAWLALIAALLPYVSALTAADLAIEAQGSIDADRALLGDATALVIEWLTSEYEVERAKFKTMALAYRAGQAR